MHPTEKILQPATAAPAPARSGSAVPLRGFGHALDTVVLAGTHEDPRRLVNGRNKAFLDIAGRPLVRHVVDALEAAQEVDQIFVVGPEQELREALQGCSNTHCVQQEGRMLSNSWAAIRAIEASRSALPPEQLRQRPILMLSSDLPLISAAAVDDFISRCALADQAAGGAVAMLVGVAEEAGLKPFYGSTQAPGISRPLVQLRDGRMRLANIYVARPREVGHSDFLQTSFNLRKAKDWRNVLKLVFSLFRQHGGWSAARMTCRLQLTAMLAAGEGRWYRKLRAGNTMDRVESGVSGVLGGPVKVVVTPYGGLSLDVDDEEDFRLLSAYYQPWMEVGTATTRQLAKAAQGTATART
jgi:GTP:adenosylcobinamide-phosphate guanylyltransferase